MVLDCRRSNLRFRSPPGTRIASAESLARLHMPSLLSASVEGVEGVHPSQRRPRRWQGRLFGALSDVSNFFYWLGLPEGAQGPLCVAPCA